MQSSIYMLDSLTGSFWKPLSIQLLDLLQTLELGIIIDSVVNFISFLGAKGVKLFKIYIQRQPALLALSSRPWVSYNYLGRTFITPLT